MKIQKGTPVPFADVPAAEPGNRTLGKLHERLIVLNSRSVMQPSTQKSHRDFSYRNRLGSLIVYDQRMSSTYITSWRENLQRDFIEQFAVDEVHWYRSMRSVMAANLKDIIATDIVAAKDGCLVFCTDEGIARSHYLEVANNGAKGMSFSNGIGPTVLYSMPAEVRTSFDVALQRGGHLSAWFGLKHGDATSAKTNVFLEDVLTSLHAYDPAVYDVIRKDLYYVGGLSNDQVTNLICSYCYLNAHAHKFSFLEYACLVHQRPLNKALCVLTKQLGVALNPFLTLYTEMDCLWGRGAVAFDITKELCHLRQRSDIHGEDVDLPVGVVYRESMNLFAEAMPLVAAVPVTERWRLFGEDLESYWRDRHANSVNGGHHLPTDCPIPDIHPLGAKTRMVFMESVQSSFLFKTLPIIEATASLKHENPKTRLIASEDTISNKNHDILARAFERNWTHAEVLLDPSLKTHEDEAARVANMSGGTYVMLDYAAMEKQHSTRSLMETCEARCDFFGLPTEMRTWFMAAEANQWIRHDSVRYRTKFGLLTGRRLTTLINSVLNRVYLKHILHDHWGLIVSIFHAGDDIILKTRNSTDAEEIIRHCVNSDNGFNAKKQSYGAGGEFLRQAVLGDNSYGYLNRSIASCVCGSWVNKLRLAETDIPSIFQRYCWTLDNRGMIRGIAAKLLTISLNARTEYGRQTAHNIASARVVINGGPVADDLDVVHLITPITKQVLREPDVNAPSFATEDYLRHIITPFVENLGPDIVGVVRSVFKRASYAKSNLLGYERGMVFHDTIPISRVWNRVNSSLLRKVNKGRLSEHPTLPSLQGNLSSNELQKLVMVLLGHRFDGHGTLDDWLFGDRTNVVACTLGVCYDDAMQYSKLEVMYGYRNGMHIITQRRCFF
jgi:hypothetical protein